MLIQAMQAIEKLALSQNQLNKIFAPQRSYR